MQARSLLLTAPEELAWIAEELPEPGDGQLARRDAGRRDQHRH